MSGQMETEVETLTRELREALDSRRGWVQRSMEHEKEIAAKDVELTQARQQVEALKAELEAAEATFDDEEAAHQETLALWKAAEQRATTAEAERDYWKARRAGFEEAMTAKAAAEAALAKARQTLEETRDDWRKLFLLESLPRSEERVRKMADQNLSAIDSALAALTPPAPQTASAECGRPMGERVTCAKPAGHAETAADGLRCSAGTGSERREENPKCANPYHATMAACLGRRESCYGVSQSTPPPSDLRAEVLHIIRSQPNAPDTRVGTRQQWVRDEIARKVEALTWPTPPPESILAPQPCRRCHGDGYPECRCSPD